MQRPVYGQMMVSHKGKKRSLRKVKRVSLKFCGIVLRTRKRYESQLRKFFQFLKDESLPLPASYRQLDQGLAEYIDHMFQEGEPLGYAGDLLSGVSRWVPHARAHIPTARLWFRNWGREVVRKRALPVPAEVVQGLAGIALALGRHDLAALLPLGFVCMLRTSELCNLKRREVVFGPRGSAIISLHQTKTSGPNTEECVLEDKVIVNALKRACKGLQPDDVIFSRPARFFGDELRWLAKFIGFSHKRLTPYSLRRGGATWHMHKFGSLAMTALAGRWKHQTTAKIYIDGAAAEWTRWQLSDEAWARVRQAKKLYRRNFTV